MYNVLCYILTLTLILNPNLSICGVHPDDSFVTHWAQRQGDKLARDVKGETCVMI